MLKPKQMLFMQRSLSCLQKTELINLIYGLIIRWGTNELTIYKRVEGSYSICHVAICHQPAPKYLCNALASALRTRVLVTRSGHANKLISLQLNSKSGSNQPLNQHFRTRHHRGHRSTQRTHVYWQQRFFRGPNTEGSLFPIPADSLK